jgi:hypothetical protein
MSIKVTSSMAAKSAIAPRNFPRMICTSVSGDVRRSSIVPDRFSSEYVRIVIIGMTNRMMIAAFSRTPRIIRSLTFTAPPPPIIPARWLSSRNAWRKALKNTPKSSAKSPMVTYAMGDAK